QQGLRCLKMQPNNVEVWALLVGIYRSQGRRADAVALADRIVRASPDFLPGLMLRSELHLDQGEYEPAIRLLRHAATRPKQDGVTATYQLSIALARAGHDAEAKQVLAELRARQALELWDHEGDESVKQEV